MKTEALSDTLVMAKISDLNNWNGGDKTLSGLKMADLTKRLEAKAPSKSNWDYAMGKLFLFLSLALVTALIFLMAFVSPRTF